MRILEIIKLLLANKDVILEIWAFIQQFLQPTTGPNGVIVFRAAPMNATAFAAATQGKSDAFKECAQYFVDHPDAAMEYVELGQKLAA